MHVDLASEGPKTVSPLDNADFLSKSAENNQIYAVIGHGSERRRSITIWMKREAKMARGWIQPHACRNLAVLVEAVTAPMLIEHSSPVCLETDVDGDLPIPCDSQRAAELIRVLCRQALKSMPDGGDLLVTGCQTSKGIELEIADSGADVETRERHLPIAAAAVNADLEWLNCPQGGVAVTIVFPFDQSSQRDSSDGRKVA